VRLSWRYFYRVTPSRQTNIRGFGFGSVPVTALRVYLFQLVSVIFTYLRADCPFVLMTSRPGRVGSWVKNPDPVPSLPVVCPQSIVYNLMFVLFEFPLPVNETVYF